MTRTKATKAVRLAAASDCRIHVEEDARMEFVRDGKKCNMKFLDADAKRPLASVHVMVDERNVVVFEPHGSCIENTSIGQAISMSRRRGVFVVQLDAQAGSRTTKHVRLNEPNTNGGTGVFQAASVNPKVEGIRERCKTPTENKESKYA